MESQQERDGDGEVGWWRKSRESAWGGGKLPAGLPSTHFFLIKGSVINISSEGAEITHQICLYLDPDLRLGAVQLLSRVKIPTHRRFFSGKTVVPSLLVQQSSHSTASQETNPYTNT